MDEDDDMAVDGEDEEDYGFEYSDDSGGEGVDENDDLMVKIENKYFMAKGLLEEDDKAAMKLFLDVVGLEKEKGTWYVLSQNDLVARSYSGNRADSAGDSRL